MEHNDFSLIIAAGGSGSRMGSDIKKQLIMWKGHPLIYHSLLAFFECGVRHAVIVCPKGERERYEELFVTSEEKNRISLELSVEVTEGGAERYDSVYRGLSLIDSTFVMVHDAARPFVTNDIISSVIRDTREYNAAIAAVPVKDTIKIIDDNGFCESTPDRSRLYAVQTPQGFRTDILKQAYESFFEERKKGASINVTDDAMLIERYTDAKVFLSKGAYSNLKITTPDDLRGLFA